MNVIRLPAVALSSLAALCMAFSAAAQPIRLGELNSYKQFPGFLEPYKKGMELALDEVNAAGGVLGRPLEIVSRD
ncbi:MAG: ABC transporter substrate-binding protein, partial [Vicinamibacterales bacterium]